MIVMKQIKPKRMKEAALRLTLLNEMRKAGTEIKRDFEKTTATWEQKPEFESVISLTGPGPVLLVATDDEIYRYVDEGTEPHEIWAGAYTGKSNKKNLAFPEGFRPKTRPGVIGSFRGSKSGKRIIRPYVMHPGGKPRRFTEIIQKRWKKKFQQRMQAAMKRAAKASGHEI